MTTRAQENNYDTLPIDPSRWPYFTADFSPLPGTIKQHFGDFIVEEIPAYEPCGSGDHVYFTIEKTGLSTRRAIGDIARALHVSPKAIGYAGLKDARGITRQMLSLEHVSLETIQTLDIPRIRVLSVSRHRNKLKTGHLHGNRFTIKLRNSDTKRTHELQRQIQLLQSKGVPNYFGSQRFGLRGDTGLIGRALLKGEWTEAAALIAGRPGPSDDGDVLKARELFDAGYFGEATHTWPRGFSECVGLCQAMKKSRGNAETAIRSLGRKTIGFYLSAWQSMLFNDVVAARINSLDQVMEGDLAWKHDNGAVFVVEDPDAEQPRVGRFEISPTGPIFGRKMKKPQGQPAAIEEKALHRADSSYADFEQRGVLSCTGVRRPLRFQPHGIACTTDQDDSGHYIELQFSLPPGCYATTVLREICKDALKEISAQSSALTSSHAGEYN